MSNKNLSAVTTDLIESYGNTAKNMIHAYRMGNQRAAHFFDQRWEKALQQSASQLRAEVRKNALAAQRTISGIYIKGVDMTSKGADVVVSKAVEMAGKGVQQVAANASAFEKRTGVTTLNSLAKASVPAVIAVGNLAGRLEQGSSSLVNTVAGKGATVQVATVKRGSAHKRAASKRQPSPRTAAMGTAAKGATKRPVARQAAARKTAVRKRAASASPAGAAA